MDGSIGTTQLQQICHARIYEEELVRMMAEDTRGRHQLAFEAGDTAKSLLFSRLLRESTWWSGQCAMTDVPSLKAPRARQRHMPAGLTRTIIILVLCWITPVTGVFIDFQNCLSDSYQNNKPRALQFVPLFVDASFDTIDPTHNLHLTVWGNVTGAVTAEPLPPANSPDWIDPTQTLGKIQNDPGELRTSISKKVNVLTYQAWKEVDSFCDDLTNGTCPLGPTFNGSLSTPWDFPSFGISNNFYSSYAFTSLTATLIILNGDANATNLACISAEITPDLGSSLSGILTFMPLLVLLLVGAATAFAGIFSLAGTTDTFRWTSNYGRDPDLLRLVTPGFGDCLQYIQFIVMTGGLTLSYPGYYQPIVSKVSWSALMFNQSFVSHGHGTQNPVDGIYVTNGTYGLEELSQLIGMTNVDDIWAGMAIWLLIILGILMMLIQLGFLFRFAFRHFSGTQEEDLRAKNMPFSVGNVIRIVFSYFLLPIVALSMFQLVVANKSPAYTVALAVLLLVAVVSFAGWLLYIVATTRPRSHLFDDLPTVLLYGPLYNTYSDNAAPFALVPVLLTIIRGIAIGAVQPSGIAQVVLLASCEIITILTLHAFRPFHSPTSMNAYHSFFAVVRLASILMMVAFSPSLGVTGGPKGWIGYAILLMHAIVLVFGFFLNAIQTIVEVAARLAGAGGDEGGTRGGLARVFGMRQLSRRLPRRDAGSRQSQISHAAMLDQERKDSSALGRVRSQSAGSAGNLLSRPRSIGLDSIGLEAANSADTPSNEASAFSFLPSPAGTAPPNRGRGGILKNLSTPDTADPYYRPPRLRRPTLDAYSPGARSRGSWASGDWASKRWSNQDGRTPTTEAAEIPLGPSISGRGTPVPGGSSSQMPGTEPAVTEPRRSKTDYTTREVDFYYGVRGPALNANVPGRRLKTGPTDPENPMVSASSWIKGLFGGKTKEKGKGFEVVRSSRMPPGMMNARSTPGANSPPEGIPEAHGVARNGLIDSDDEDEVVRPGASQPAAADDASEVSEVEGDDEEFEMTRISDIPPSLPDFGDLGDELRMPSRLPSDASIKIPRKSSRRASKQLSGSKTEARKLYDPVPEHTYMDSTGSSRLPFDRSNSKGHSTISTRSSIGGRVDEQDRGKHLSTIDDSPTSLGHVHHHSIRTIAPALNNVDLLGSSAEFVDEERRSRSSQRR